MFQSGKIETPEEAANFLRLIAEGVADERNKNLIKERCIELGVKQAEGDAKMVIFLQAVCFVRCHFHPTSRLRPYMNDPSPLLASLTQFSDDPGVMIQIASLKASMHHKAESEPAL
jgi:hypothetical protein